MKKKSLLRDGKLISCLKVCDIDHMIFQNDLGSKSNYVLFFTYVLARAVIHSDEEDYDSEMDDFIDDSDVPGEDISSVIGQIFGYNKRKYTNEESDDECMESSVHEQWREEQRSLRIGKD
jgi:hypothetical protein